MNDFSTVLGGIRWSVFWVTKKDMPKKTWGLCCWESKTIRVRKDLSIRNRLDTLLHEMRHAQHVIAYEAESWIDKTSTELADGICESGSLDI